MILTMLMIIGGVVVCNFKSKASEKEESSNVEIVQLQEAVDDDSIDVIGMTEYTSSDKSDEINIDTAIVMDDIAVPLFPTYDNSEDVLNKVKDNCSNILSLLGKVYNLETLSSTNWNEYYNLMYEYLDDENKEEWYTEDNKEFVELGEFFDIYENSNSNQQIVEYIKENNNVDSLVNNVDFVNSLPHNSVEEIKEKYDIKEKEDITRASFNVAKAVSYAEKYAKKPNSSKFKTCGADCTNFVSQIAYAGGKKMTGKWYAKKGLLIDRDKYVSYSNQWCNANSFVNYWKGGCPEYVDHRSFSLYLKKGCFISYDKQDDGDWDHMAFVCDVKKFSDKLGYADYKVAQHSGSYCAWTSTNDNDWDLLEKTYKKLVFTIVNIK